MRKDAAIPHAPKRRDLIQSCALACFERGGGFGSDGDGKNVGAVGMSLRSRWVALWSMYFRFLIPIRSVIGVGCHGLPLNRAIVPAGLLLVNATISGHCIVLMRPLMSLAIHGTLKPRHVAVA